MAGRDSGWLASAAGQTGFAVNAFDFRQVFHGVVSDCDHGAIPVLANCGRPKPESPCWPVVDAVPLPVEVSGVNCVVPPTFTGVGVCALPK